MNEINIPFLAHASGLKDFHAQHLKRTLYYNGRAIH